MHIRIGLPGGTLKIKSIGYLRSFEHERQVPVKKIGSLYFIWIPRGFQPKR
jgi:hypothetical protein